MIRSPRTRVWVPVLLLAGLTLGSVAYVRFTADREAGKARRAATSTGLPEATDDEAGGSPAILTVNRSPGTDYGTVARLDPDGTVTPYPDLTCERVHTGSSLGGCLKPTPQQAPGPLSLSLDESELVLFDAAAGTVQGSYPVAGRPSRLRLSPDDRYAAYTTFVTGHSYAVASNLFSTNSVIVDTRSGLHRWVETFQVVDRQGRLIDDPTRNYWGISFSPVDSDTFYAALGIGDQNWIIEGSVTEQRAAIIAEGLMCPSASPDGRHLVARDRTNEGRYAIYDLETGTHQLLTEDRIVDDQAEWLDERTISYAVARPDSPADQTVYDLWVLDVTTGERRELARAANSPATVRQAGAAAP